MNDILQAVVVRSVSGHAPLVDLETGSGPDSFLAQIDELQANITEIEHRQHALKRLHESGKVLIKSKDIQRHRDEMQATVEGVNKLAHQVKARLEALEKEDASLRRSQATGFADQDRRKTLIAAVRTKLKNQMGEFSKIRSFIQEEYRQVVERRVYAVTGQRISQEEIDQLIETGESESVFRQAILQNGRPAILATMAEIEERHAAAKSLEQGLMELNTLFLEMAVLVEEQGQKLNNIEDTVHRTRTFVQQGTEHILVAKRHWQRSNQCKWYAVVIFLIAIVLVAIFILQPWRTKK